ncbi:TRAP transporter small permease [Shinella sp. 838]|uniref:TRAP transporter small permease n=1 Tax=Shinella sp. 838 TaxID=3038164 RepID=UPI002414EE9A|nr:TRAP transporter small permease [Shinella sp. 838]MDG4674867.1 TRAP transporter small permease [Shinella sp. 838]
MKDKSADAGAANDLPIIHVEADAPEAITLHVDDILAFIIFLVMAGVTFLQFFSRYVLNDSIAWTEEIARYLLMTVTFVGAAIVFRRRSNIAVEIIVDALPPTLGRLIRFLADCVTVLFVGLLAWFSWTVTQRMAIQRMTVIDLSMSIVYAGVGVGCLLMLWRAVQTFIANAKRGWQFPNQIDQTAID